MAMKRNRFYKKFKAYFIRFRLHKFFGLFSEYMIYLGYLTRLSKYIDKNRSNFEFNDFFNKRPDFDKRTDLYEFLIEKENLKDAINFLEFGVYRGKSLNWWVENNTNPDSRFWGFDTFTGLPEDWGNYKKGTFSLKGEFPDIQDSRLKFVKGLFQDTTYKTLKEVDFSKRTIFHIDVDLYTAALFVLAVIHPYMKAGDIILFDEFCVPLHEFKAFQEFTSSFYVDMTPLGAKNNYLASAFKVIRV